jgi:hypothetical protein
VREPIGERKIAVPVMTELDLEEEIDEEVEEEGDRVLPHDMESSLTDVPFNLLPLSGRDQTRKVGLIKLKARLASMA